MTLDQSVTGAAAARLLPSFTSPRPSPPSALARVPCGWGPPSSPPDLELCACKGLLGSRAREGGGSGVVWAHGRENCQYLKAAWVLCGPGFPGAFVTLGEPEYHSSERVLCFERLVGTRYSKFNGTMTGISMARCGRGWPADRRGGHRAGPRSPWPATAR